MSRSRHTDPLAIRAARRLRSPREGRGAAAANRRQRLARVLKELGITSDSLESELRDDVVRLRITVRRPRPGYHHPLGRADIARLFEQLGPDARYGLKLIELARSPDTANPGLPLLGSLEAPGRIILYEQPAPPWRLSGTLSKVEWDRLERAGAVLSVCDDGETTIAEWPGDTLSRFMLLDVLLHELGHHFLQHNKGKRNPRIARTKDHESYAEGFAKRFAERIRRALYDEEGIEG